MIYNEHIQYTQVPPTELLPPQLFSIGYYKALPKGSIWKNSTVLEGHVPEPSVLGQTTHGALNVNLGSQGIFSYMDNSCPEHFFSTTKSCFALPHSKCIDLWLYN